MPLHPVEPDRFRAVMGHFATGVAVVTATAPEGPVGMTANAVCSLSLDPLLLLVCFDHGARTLRVVRDTERFGVNVLAAGEDAIARRFASKLPEAEKFAGVAARGAGRHPRARGRARLGRAAGSSGWCPAATTRSGSARSRPRRRARGASR